MTIFASCLLYAKGLSIWIFKNIWGGKVKNEEKKFQGVLLKKYGFNLDNQSNQNYKSFLRL